MPIEIGTAVKVKDDLYVLDGRIQNKDPKKCYRCRLRNSGETVVVVVRTGPGQDAKSLWWCEGCAEQFYGLHADTLIQAEPEVVGAY